MNTHKHGHRMMRFLIPLIIIVAVLLSGCTEPPSSSSSASDSSSSSSQQIESIREPLPTVSSSSVSEESNISTPSYDMDSWDWQEHSFEGYTISLPSSCSIVADNKIDVNEAQIPQSLFKINSYPATIGWLLKDVGLKSFSVEKVDDTTYSITPWSDSEPKRVTSILSDDATLPDETFYEYKDYLVFTNIASSGGGNGSREIFSKDTVYIPKNGQGPGIMFFGEESSTECKPFYERVIDSIKPDTK